MPNNYPLRLTERLLQGVCIPAHPLALDANRRLDALRQRALTRYYMDSGVDGVAVGVHTTQFAIRDSQHSLFEPVLELAADTVRQYASTRDIASPLLIAGACGTTLQAVAESECAHRLGYDAVLLSLAAFASASDRELLKHVRAVSEVMPVIGFYLQPAVGGRVLSYEFWREFSEITNVVAIKIAPFNRYQTLDVVRAVASSSRWNEISLLTGNDDAIVHDLLSHYEFTVDGERRRLAFNGGLLGHWACWTRASVTWFHQLKRLQAQPSTHGYCEMNLLATQVTDMNAAIFDVKNGFRGCIAGIHEVLRRQGLLEGTWCLDPHETLSPGQAEEITRVTQSYPHLIDDAFVRDHLQQWYLA